jgi:ACS family hexuronate transporter-like MFS transporter
VLVSLAGVTLVLRWLAGVTAADPEPDRDRGTFLRRLAVLVVVVVSINTAWHFFRAWLPLFLQNQHHYSESFMNWFVLGYYVSTDVGSLAAGWATLSLARRGRAVHSSRVFVFGASAGLCALGAAAAFLPAGPLLLGVLLVVGFGALGLFPNYYSFSQELTSRHQGKLTGALGCTCWLAMAPVHEAVGDVVSGQARIRWGWRWRRWPRCWGSPRWPSSGARTRRPGRSCPRQTRPTGGVPPSSPPLSAIDNASTSLFSDPVAGRARRRPCLG